MTFPSILDLLDGDDAGAGQGSPGSGDNLHATGCHRLMPSDETAGQAVLDDRFGYRLGGSERGSVRACPEGYRGGDDGDSEVGASHGGLIPQKVRVRVLS